MPRKIRLKEPPALELERQLLRAMCSRRVSRERIIRATGQLANYAWLVPEHATVFEAIRRAVRLNHPSWLKLLPAQATRMGFPDVEWAEYLATNSGEVSSLGELMSRLVGGDSMRSDASASTR